MSYFHSFSYKAKFDRNEPLDVMELAIQLHRSIIPTAVGNTKAKHNSLSEKNQDRTIVPNSINIKVEPRKMKSVNLELVFSMSHFVIYSPMLETFFLELTERLRSYDRRWKVNNSQ